jgi:hypothetical protein
MKHLSLLLSIVSLSLLPVSTFAASSSSSSSSSSKTHSSTLTGCLNGPDSDGRYTLKSGAKNVDVAGPADLKDHVGQKVKLEGSWTKSTTDKSAAATKTTAHERQFKAASVERVADTCTSSSSKMTHSSSAKSQTSTKTNSSTAPSR